MTPRLLPLLGLLIRAVTQRALAPAGTLAAELQLRDGNHLAATQRRLGVTRL